MSSSRAPDAGQESRLTAPPPIVSNETSPASLSATSVSSPVSAAVDVDTGVTRGPAASRWPSASSATWRRSSVARPESPIAWTSLVRAPGSEALNPSSIQSTPGTSAPADRRMSVAPFTSSPGTPRTATTVTGTWFRRRAVTCGCDWAMNVSRPFTWSRRARLSARSASARFFTESIWALRRSTIARSMTVEPITTPSASARNTATSDTRWKRKLITRRPCPRCAASRLGSPPRGRTGTRGAVPTNIARKAAPISRARSRRRRRVS